jgi:hypothetical protein
MSQPIVSPNAPILEEVPAGDAGSTARLSEALREIAQLQELDEDWDLDGARPIDPQAMQLASGVVRAVEELAAQEGVNWQQPEIGPVPDGSVAVTWEGNDRDTLMVFRPGQAISVECVTQEEGAGPIRRVVPEAEAVRLALWALGDG